jgi:hypothetical protein
MKVKSQEEHITTTHQKPGRAHYYYTPKARKSTLLLHTKSQEEHITTTHQKPRRAHYYYTPKARKSTLLLHTKKESYKENNMIEQEGHHTWSHRELWYPPGASTFIPGFSVVFLFTNR